MKQALVLWDIDRTLVYTGHTDRQVYRDVFAELVGRPADRLPAKGTGMTVPLAVRQLLADNDVPDDIAQQLQARFLEALPAKLDEMRDHIREHGEILPGAPEALAAVAADPVLVASVLTGNLRPSAETKLDTFRLAQFLDLDTGAYSSDSADRPSLVAIAQQRAEAQYGVTFACANTVIIGDSLEDVRTAVEGGARVVGVASGTTSMELLMQAGADTVLESLLDTKAVLKAIHALTA